MVYKINDNAFIFEGTGQIFSSRREAEVAAHLFMMQQEAEKEILTKEFGEIINQICNKTMISLSIPKELIDPPTPLSDMKPKKTFNGRRNISRERS